MVTLYLLNALYRIVGVFRRMLWQYAMLNRSDILKLQSNLMGRVQGVLSPQTGLPRIILNKTKELKPKN